MARVLERDEDARKYGDRFQSIKAAFNREFVAADGRIRGDTQAGYALALDFSLLPEALEKTAVAHMVEGIHRYGNRLSTGIQSTHRLMLELVRHGQEELGWRLLTNRCFPSWGYMIDNGATTIWERWDGYVKGQGFQDPGMNSFNHWALGAIGEWMYRHVLGINPDESHPGYRQFTVRPRPGGGLTWARGHYDSIKGRIAVAWALKDGTFTLDLTVPVNATARLYVPAQDSTKILEGGRPAAEAPGVKALPAQDKCALFSVGSGSYHFSAPRSSVR
jgi:alpha-L-rhamnosidase